MRRARIRLLMAKAITETLPFGHRLTYPNVRRYVSRDLLTLYRITRDTEIHSADWMVALKVAREERVTRQRDGLLPGGQPPTIARLNKIQQEIF